MQMKKIFSLENSIRRESTMTFYQELQLSSTGSKQLIKNTADKKEKRRHILIYNFKVYLVMAFHDRDDVLGEAALTEQKEGVSGGCLY